ncbi:biotin/lipoyl-containing protein, partial [Kitasatospora indigofera]|uniref:ATP-binding protein n=1 Tax=Kitasatospora indigofera TaxID=67307 RepID=UPI0036A7A942
MLARQAGVPVVPGTDGPTTIDEARDFLTRYGPVMVKAVSGGGGRGMHVVRTVLELEEAFERCASEALTAFGDNALYVEQLVTSARHIEVQIAGDGTGAVQHLWDRDCTIQRRRQKLVEIAPSPALTPALRERLLRAALRLGTDVRYKTVGTIEFLVRDDEFWFMEANPRIQVEHTVTEEVTGVDLVQVQIRLTLGESLAAVGLAEPPPLSGSSVQARVNLETMAADGTPKPQAGILTAFTPPTGPGTRTDTCGYAGYRTNPRYDSLLAKVVTKGHDLATALGRSYAALSEFHVAGVPTNIHLLQGLVERPELLEGLTTTTFVTEHLADLAARTHPRRYPDLLRQDAPSATPDAGRLTSAVPTAALPDSTLAVCAPMLGVVVGVHVTEGETVAAGSRLVVLEAMKMEYAVRAERTGTVSALLVQAGDVVAEAAPLLLLAPADVP